MTVIDSSVIQLGLSALPDDTIPPELYDDFFQLHRAIQNLARAVSKYTGADVPPVDTWNDIQFSDTLLLGNSTRLYIRAAVPILRGQAVNLFNNAGVIGLRLASASTSATLAHGISNSTAAIGEVCEINWLRGLLDSVGGMTVGTLYWLSPTPGAIQPTIPGPANPRQTIGVALSPNQLLMDIPLLYI